MHHVECTRACGAARKAASKSGANAKANPTQGHLQMRLDALLQAGVDAAGAEELLPQLAAQGECEAVIAVWDGLKAQQLVPSKTAWAALEKLHKRGKGKIPHGTLAVCGVAKRTLAPGRRLHKIMKGRQMSARSDAALQFIGPATAWVATERKKGRPLNCKSAKARIALAKQLRDDLSLPTLEVARGVVTKLKQKKILL